MLIYFLNGTINIMANTNESRHLYDAKSILKFPPQQLDFGNFKIISAFCK